MNAGRCKSCNAPITWLDMLSGSRMPVDAEGRKMVMLTEDKRGAIVTVYTPHWATCPSANTHRKPVVKADRRPGK